MTRRFLTSVTLPADPTAALESATKQYVDNVTLNLAWKQPVRYATTTNIGIGSAGQPIDGVVAAIGDRILVKNQTLPHQNGIYTVASGAWSRTGDADSASRLDGAAVYVTSGNTQANTMWALTTDPPITIGTTNLLWSQIGGGGSAVEVNVSTAGPTTRVSELLWVDTDATLPAPVATGWQTLTLNSPWLAYPSGWQQPGIRRIGDIIELRGLLASNGAVSPSTIAMVPPPVGNLLFLGNGDPSGGGWAVDLRIYTDGRMQMQSPTQSYVGLSMVRYSVA